MQQTKWNKNECRSVLLARQEQQGEKMKPMLRTLLVTIMLISAPAGAEITTREQADRALTRLDGAIAKSPKTARFYTERGDITTSSMIFAARLRTTPPH